MIVTFEYQNNRTCHNFMIVDFEKFFSNTIRNTKKLFKFMLPNLSSQKIQGIEDWLSGKEDKRYKRYLEIFREVKKNEIY